MHKKIVYLVCLFLLHFSASSQKVDEELAAQFLASNEFAKAADLYEKLLGSNPKSIYYYDNLLKSYIGQQDFGSAQKIIKKQIKRFEQNYYYAVDEGYVYQIQNQHEKATKVYQKLIQDVPPLEAKIFELAKAFEKRRLGQMAIETYLAGRKNIKSDYLFSMELSGLYLDIGNIKSFIEELLNSLVLSDQHLEEVQGLLQNNLESNADFEILKAGINKRLKQFPDKSCFQELIIWMHVQRNEYELAALYAKSLDKKNKEDGRRLLELGFMASNNEKYDAAISIYKQIQLLGKDKPYYSYAKSSELEARTKKLTQGTYTAEDLLLLENEYKLTLSEMGVNPITAPTVKQLANLQAFFLNKYSEAVDNYELLLKMPRNDRYLLAQVKLELGDLYLLKNQMWESMLLYGQVDKDFLEEPIGQEAKFRNAKLSYYLGEFDWAKAQLDVLKTATTQLISNNAIELSLLIQDNTIDSTETEPLALFAKADLNYAQGNYAIAISVLDSIQKLYPKSGLADDILYKKAEIAMKKKDYETAANLFGEVYRSYGSDILGDNALFNLAKLQQQKLNKPEDALKNYEKFMAEYPGSFFLNDCIKQFRLLRGDLIN